MKLKLEHRYTKKPLSLCKELIGRHPESRPIKFRVQKNLDDHFLFTVIKIYPCRLVVASKPGQLPFRVTPRVSFDEVDHLLAF